MGDEPINPITVHPKKWNVWTRFFVQLAAAGAIIVGLWSGALSYMKAVSDSRFDDRLKPHVEEENGLVRKAIDETVREHEIKTETERREQMHQIERRMQRQDYMIDEIYQEVTGREPPPQIAGGL